MALFDLEQLIYCHSTSGEEDEVMALLAQKWRNKPNWECGKLGRYAFYAEQKGSFAQERKRILVCAHADSPGYSIDSWDGKNGTAVPIGGASFNPDFPHGIIHTAMGKIKVKLTETENGVAFQHNSTEIRRGDRIAFEPSFSVSSNKTRLIAPFMDNRVGCWLLNELFNFLPPLPVCPSQIILAVTGSEEFTGFGAAALANHLKADLVLCLDTTYVSEAQEVTLDGGPVLTLSDKSVVVSRKLHNALRDLCNQWGIPLQTEVYNFSGTDAVAFPRTGCLAPVLPILVPSLGNHSPRETVSVKDLELTRLLLRKICLAPNVISKLTNAFSWTI